MTLPPALGNLTDQLGQILATAILILVGSLIAHITAWVKMNRARYEPKTPLEKTPRIDIEIHIRLDRVLRRFPAALRVYVSKFHNGDQFVDGSDVLKKSRTHERVRPGISYQAENFRGMLTSTVPEEMALVLEQGPSWTAVSQIPPSKFRWLCENGGARSVVRCAVFKRKKVIAFVGVDLDTDDRAPEGIEFVSEVAEEISGLLSGY